MPIVNDYTTEYPTTDRTSPAAFALTEIKKNVHTIEEEANEVEVRGGLVVIACAVV